MPPVARGFAIHLPKGKLIDLGTEFGLNVHSGGSTEIYVYRGKIIYEGKSGADYVSREVNGGERFLLILMARLIGWRCLANRFWVQPIWHSGLWSIPKGGMRLG